MSALRRWGLVALLVCMPPVACAQDADPASLATRAVAARQGGRYDDAIKLAREALARDSTHVVATRVLMRALTDVGRHAEVIEAGERFRRATNGARDADVLLGDAHRARGDVAAARAAYERGRGGRDSLTARLQLAMLALEGGARDEAMRAFDSFIDTYNSARARLTADELRAVAVACRVLGRNDPQLFKDALKAYDESIAADSTNLETRTELGFLFLEKFNAADARTMFEGVLKVNARHPRALLGMSRVLSFDGRGDPSSYVRQSLEVNPGDPDARAVSALLLIDVERYDDAANEAIRGLAADTGAAPPLVALAAARWLSGDSANFQRALARAHARLVGSADAEVTLADVAARNRLYRDATAFAAQGVARDPRAARALALLGVNQLRIGQVADGKANLDRAFAIDPYDVWAKNTLDLLDTFDGYAEVRTPRFVLVMEKKDAPLLSLYAGPLAEMAFDSLSARYGYRPTEPVRIEFFRSHADFSVRTVGLAGLGALGVCFGPVVAMDSPAARKVGEFNWGSTLWHEVAHTFTLGATANRIPRWFSEGLSVLEERRARPSWGSDVSPDFLAAYAGGMLAPPSRMNDGFMRPRFPQEVILSYYQASLIAEWIEELKSMAGIRAMLAAYARGANTATIVRDVLGYDMAAFDREFDRWIRARFAREFAAVSMEGGKGAGHDEGIRWNGPFADAMRAATAAAERQRWDEAVRELERAKGLFPAYAGEDSPYRTLAEIHLTRGDSAGATRELQAMTLRNELAFDANVQLAALAQARRDSAGSAAALERTLFISPFDLGIHERLAEQAGRMGRHTVAIRERQAVLALDPPDRVEALTQLARAYAEAGEVAQARREVLRALDLAPNYEKAQALLLSLQEKRP
ncbi:MAG: tetratricopeptide repeat protein [Gemmatimonadaceae bacterium]